MRFSLEKAHDAPGQFGPIQFNADDLTVARAYAQWQASLIATRLVLSYNDQTAHQDSDGLKKIRGVQREPFTPAIGTLEIELPIGITLD